MDARPLAVELTRAAGCFVWRFCVLQRDVVFSFCNGWWVGGCVGAAGIVQRDGVRGLHFRCRGLELEHAESDLFIPSSRPWSLLSAKPYDDCIISPMVR